MIGGAILPALLHQDPRYFYQGTGSNKSRALHALVAPLVCRGDNGRLQTNYSSVGGDLASAALSNAYYPPSNRGAGLVLPQVPSMRSPDAERDVLEDQSGAAIRRRIVGVWRELRRRGRRLRLSSSVVAARCLRGRRAEHEGM